MLSWVSNTRNETPHLRDVVRKRDDIPRRRPYVDSWGFEWAYSSPVSQHVLDDMSRATNNFKQE